MHVKDPEREGYTLCGQRWWFECEHGDLYCKSCQCYLAKRLNKETEDTDTPQTPEKQ